MGEQVKMNAKIQNGQVEYVGFNPSDNDKWIVETRGTYTYVNYQKDEFTQVIFGYVIEQKNGKYKAFHGLDDKNAKYFEMVEDGIKYVKSFAKK